MSVLNYADRRISLSSVFHNSLIDPDSTFGVCVYMSMYMSVSLGACMCVYVYMGNVYICKKQCACRH